MAEERFDLSYAGDLVPGADPTIVRERLTAAFKLSDQGIERLFTGQPVIVKRSADAATVARFERVFTQAGAILRISRTETPSDADDPEVAPAQLAERPADSAAGLTLATDASFLEEPRTVNISRFDTGSLSLVSGQDWSLADCEPPSKPAPIPDIGHLRLADAEPTHDRNDPAD
jgi:hypothetical protein